MMGAFWKSDSSHAQRRPTPALVAGLALLLVLTGPTAWAQDPNAAKPVAAERPQKPPETSQRLVRLIPITLPIADQTGRLQRAIRRVLDQAGSEQKQAVLILEFRVPAKQEDFGRGSQFGPCYELANFLSSQELNRAKTIAFLPKTIQGHAVLVALACDEIVMDPDAQIGNAGVDTPNVDPAMQAAYKDIADRRKRVPGAVALAMVDPSQEIWQLETEVSREYVTREGREKRVEELSKTHMVRVAEKPLFAAGQPHQLSGSEARRLDFASALAKDHLELARAQGLPPEAIQEDPSLLGTWTAVRVELKGDIHAEMVNHAQRLIRDAVNDKKANFICLVIDSPGGSPVDSLSLANFLASFDPGQVRTVAYIPSEARGDAALIAMACDQVVMHPKAILGGPGEHAFEDDEIKQIRQTIREELAPRKSRSWSLIAAMIDPKLDVFRYVQKSGEPAFFSEEEFNQQKEEERGKWTKVEQVTEPGRPFSVEGQKAVDYRLAYKAADNFTDFKQLYGLENDPSLLEPSWVDYLVNLLASPAVAFTLLIVGFVALYIELHAPGIGAGGFVAAVCFLLFFWSKFLGGTAGWLEILLFVAGIGFLLIEVFVLPGFGIFGLGGGLMILLSLVLASQTFIIPRNEYQFAELQRSMLMIAGVAVGVFAAALVLNRYLPHTPMLGKVMLQPPSDEEAQMMDRRAASFDYDAELVGSQGTTITPLVPSGKARFGNRVLDVIADGGDAVGRGVMVEIIEIHGNRVLVRTVDELT